MTDHTVILQFNTAKGKLEDEWNVFEQMGPWIFGDQFDDLSTTITIGDHQKMLIFKSKNRNWAVMMGYLKEDLVIVDVHFLIQKKDEWKLDLEYIRGMENKIKKNLGHACTRSESLFSSIKRGNDLWRYFVTSDERIVEPDFVELVAEEQSRYQQVQIFRSTEHGKVLYLDEDVMLGEGDEETYTRTLLGVPDRNSFSGKEILILGGGDGGIIYELLKLQPAMVIMVEIDETVIRLCRKHMRSVCGEAMDDFEGPNKKIIIGDCLEYLHKCIKEGKTFDYVINDLTEFPVNKEERGWGYDFETHCSQVFELSLMSMKTSGKYLSRGGPLSDKRFWLQFESDCKKKGCKFQVVNSFVRSFHETYRLYEVSRA